MRRDDETEWISEKLEQLKHQEFLLNRVLKIRGAFGSKPDDHQISVTRACKIKRSRPMATYGEIDVTNSKI